jgi:hypothetical protein
MDAFIDSVVLIGAFYRNDQWHAQAALDPERVNSSVI